MPKKSSLAKFHAKRAKREAKNLPTMKRADMVPAQPAPPERPARPCQNQGLKVGGIPCKTCGGDPENPVKIAVMSCLVHGQCVNFPVKPIDPETPAPQACSKCHDFR